MAKNKKLKIAVTGNIGSGKSLFCKYLSEQNFQVIEADNIAKEILSSNPRVKEKIIKEFGSDSYLNNELNRKYLAGNIFSNPVSLKKINSIVHPETIKRINELIEKVFIKEDIVFIEAALIYEADMEKLFDFVVLICADERIRKQRKIKNDDYSEEEFNKRNLNQISEEEKKKRADFVFENNEGIIELKKKADFLLKILHVL
jgi:dephospho-CoA kinase